MKLIKFPLGRGISKLNFLDYKFEKEAEKRKPHKQKNAENFIKLFELVTQKCSINRFEAYATLGFTPGVYERIHPAFIERYKPRIIYNKKTKCYVDTISVQNEQETLI